MLKRLLKPLLGGAAAVALAAIAYAPAANAACWWNGYSWSCDYAPAYSYSQPAWQPNPYPAYGAYYDPYAPYYGYGPSGRYPGPKAN